MGVLLGNGDGTFQPPVTYPTGVFTSGILIADFDQDGIPDIAAMSQGDGTDGRVASSSVMVTALSRIQSSTTSGSFR